ncbi:hypothetical protein KC340_g13265 [Hortaea werneckii]|nr:hypothetical protein KC342_g7138 [Hortaea werneckii]KAI7096648.1 hypothetical protein KC339_g10229 [Hortaea werneckii]KAI7224375.1 hypothetical protein KC365_g10749 [Hortaea werneckii]KAI7300740.1 hypothetical protein KC340_g13265 [Hortaea werneckii]KAI7385986.1 hypothetical protein KC328_g10067 [Hortaea werneckii]
MSFLRVTRQPAIRSLTRSTNTPTLAFTPRRLAHQDYGSGEGNPAGENPQAQGKNPSEKAEHPGPEPPTAGKKAGKKSQQQQQQGGGSQQQPSSSSNNNKGTQDASSSSSPQPRILNDPPPPASGSQGAPGEVKQHNREMDQRAEKPHPKGRAEEDVEKDKVPKGFWAGQGGADRQP